MYAALLAVGCAGGNDERTGKSSVTSEVASDATVVPTTEPSAPPPQPAGCTGQIGGVSYEVTLPDGWHSNEAAEPAPACQLFAPERVETHIGETESDPGLHSNAVVRFAMPYPPGEPPPFSFDERMNTNAISDGVLDSQRTTIDGRPAARFERTTLAGDGYPGGDTQVIWHIDLGTVELAATMHAQDLSYHEAVAGLDAIAHSLRFPA